MVLHSMLILLFLAVDGHFNSGIVKIVDVNLYTLFVFSDDPLAKRPTIIPSVPSEVVVPSDGSQDTDVKVLKIIIYVC